MTAPPQDLPGMRTGGPDGPADLAASVALSQATDAIREAAASVTPGA